MGLDVQRLETLARTAQGHADARMDELRLIAAEGRTVFTELSPDELALVTPGAGASAINIGFPFPLASVPWEVPGAQVQYFLRGEAVRREQRTYLCERLGLDLETSDRGQFLERTASLQQGRPPVYVDPYTFIGDGFIGLYFRDSLVGRCPVFTRSHRHMDALEDARPLQQAATAKGSFMVMPDLVDTHLETTLGLLEGLRGTDTAVALVGRNMLIDMRTGAASWLPIADPLLRAKNIEDYMDECLEPYTAARPPEPPRTIPRAHDWVFVNALSSATEKDLAPQFVADVCRALLDAGTSRIGVSTGIAGNGKDDEWCAAFRRYDGDRRIELCDFKSLSEMTRYFQQGVTLGVTADTSVSHLLNHLSIPNFVIGRERFWDSRSKQSLAGSSPLGFTRYHNFQFPFVLREGREDDVIGAVIGVLKRPAPPADVTAYDAALAQVKEDPSAAACLARLHDGLAARAPYLAYDPRSIVEHVPDAGHLIHSAYRISPAYKMARAR